MTGGEWIFGLWPGLVPLGLLPAGLAIGRALAMVRAGEADPRALAVLMACCVPLPLAPWWVMAGPAQWLGLLALVLAGGLFAVLCASGLRGARDSVSARIAALVCAGLLPAGFGLLQAVGRMILEDAPGTGAAPPFLLLIAAACGAASLPLLRPGLSLAAGAGLGAMALAFAAAGRAGLPGGLGWAEVLAFLAALLLPPLLLGWRREKRLAAAREDELAEALVASLPEPAALLRDGRVQAWNPLLRQLIGQSEILLHERGLADLFPRQGQALAAALASGSGQGWQRAELLAARESIPVEVMARAIWPGHKGPRLLLVRDLRRALAQEARLAFLQENDASTGLHNRAWLMARLEEAVARETGRQGAFNLLRIGMDGYNAFQALHGHAATEAVLRIQAERVREMLPRGAALARIEGGEMALLHEQNALAESAERLARRVLETLRAPVPVGQAARRLAFSIGLAGYPQDGETPDELMTAADLALLRARDSRRGAQPADAGRDQETLARWALAQELPAAIEGHQLRVWLQPQMRLSDMRLCGFEALLRWQHPVHGLIGPARFIEAAEAMGHINAVGRWVLEEAVRRAAGWPLPLPVAVNVSPQQLERPGFVLEVEQALARHGLAPERLELEITESGLLEQGGVSMQTLQRLHGLGVRISLDDFGSGYSSFATLCSFPFSKLKLDRTLLVGTATHPPRAAMEAVLALGRALGIPVTAEGVETPEQLRMLLATDCAYVQGYLLGRPVSEAQARLDWLDGHAVPPLLWRQPLSAEQPQGDQPQIGRDQEGGEGNAGAGKRPRASAARAAPRAPRQPQAQNQHNGHDQGLEQGIGLDQGQQRGQLEVPAAEDAQPPRRQQRGQRDGAAGQGARPATRRRVQQPDQGEPKPRKQPQVRNAPLAQVADSDGHSPEGERHEP